MNPELEARKPGLRDFEDRTSHPPPVPDEAPVQVDPRDRQVLAKGSRLRGEAELCGPPVVVLLGVGVDVLVVPAVNLSVRPVVTDDVDATNPQAPLNGELPDRRGERSFR